MEIDREFVYGDLRYETVNDNIRARRCYLDWLTYHGSSHRTLHLHPFELSMCSNSGRLRVVPHFLWRDSKESKTRARLKITPREEGEIRRGERKIRDYRQGQSFWPFTADWFWSVKLVSPFKSVTRIQWDPLSHWTVIALQVISRRPRVIDLD